VRSSIEINWDSIEINDIKEESHPVDIVTLAEAPGLKTTREGTWGRDSAVPHIVWPPRKQTCGKCIGCVSFIFGSKYLPKSGSIFSVQPSSLGVQNFKSYGHTMLYSWLRVLLPKIGYCRLSISIEPWTWFEKKASSWAFWIFSSISSIFLSMCPAASCRITLVQRNLGPEPRPV
jgi:hypothetical protein